MGRVDGGFVFLDALVTLLIASVAFLLVIGYLALTSTVSVRVEKRLRELVTVQNEYAVIRETELGGDGFESASPR